MGSSAERSTPRGSGSSALRRAVPQLRDRPAPERLARRLPAGTLARLRELKRRYDPGNLFRDNFNIPGALTRPARARREHSDDGRLRPRPAVRRVHHAGRPSPRSSAVELAVAAERAGLDLATFQDHPYQPRFHDTWTLLSYAAARTERIRLSGNVLSLPLRPPAVLARSRASLDLLTAAGSSSASAPARFWDAIEAMGGRRLTAGQGVEALGEAIEVIRQLWDAERDAVRPRRRVLPGGRRQTRPPRPHDDPIWVGAYKPRMLALTGARPTAGCPARVPRGASRCLAGANARIDDAAQEAGRTRPRAAADELHHGQSQPVRARAPGRAGRAWVDRLTALALGDGVSAFLSAATTRHLARFGNEIAPAVREHVARARRGEE